MKHWINYVLLVSFSLLLWGCDNTETNLSKPDDNTQNEIVVEFDDTPVISNKIDLPDATTANSGNHKLAFAPSKELIKQYQNKSLSVLDSSEMILEGASTLVVTFSVPLDPKQNFNNVIRLIEDGKGDLDGHWELSSNGLELRHRYLEPNRKLSLHIDKMLQAINGERLKSAYKANITTRDRLPMVGFSSNGSLLPSKSMTGLPITTLNVNQVDVNFFRIKSDKIYDFMLDYGSVKLLSVWSSQYALSYADLVYSARFNLAPKANVQENVIIDLTNINELKGEGTYIAILNQSGSYNYSNPMTIFSISNVGISVHSYEKGKLAVFAHRLDDGSALDNIQITALCAKKVEKCQPVNVKTNKQGYAEFKLNLDGQYRLLTASDGEQMSFVYIDRGALDLSEFNVLGNTFYQKQLFTFGPRDLYRPNETVNLNALLRDADGQLLPDQPIKTEIISPTGQIIKDFVWKATDKQSGFYQTEYLIPTNAATGKWLFKFNLGDDIYRYHSFSVEEFLPERMTITLTPTADKPILNNQDATFAVKGWYLYGAPASGNELQANIVVLKERSVAQLTGFNIGSVSEANIDRQLNSINQTLNNQGVTQITIDKQNWSDIKSPIKVVLQASVLDVGGRPVTRSVTQTIWPATQMPAIRALFAESRYYDWSLDKYVNRPTVDIGNNAEFEIAYVDGKGNKLSSNQLTVRFVKERRDYYWTWSDSEGWQAQYDQKEFVISEDKIKVAANDVTKVSFLPDDEGSYRIEVIDAKNNVMSSMRFWHGYSWSDNTDHSGAVRPDQVKLSLDKATYQIGDTAKVHIEAPVSGSGYVSLETNDGTLWMKEIAVSQNGIDVDIPVKDWGRHDIYINAMVVRPSTDSAIQTIKRAVGLLYFPIDTSSRQLKLNIISPQKTHPDKTVKIKVSVANKQAANGKITVLLSAVDSGVLNITDFVTPDPYSAFLGRKRYNVEQFDVYGKLIEGGGRLVGISFGGDSSMSLQSVAGGKKPLTQVNIVAQQLKTVMLNSKGEGELDLAIPDFNGELRLMAQAWDSHRFGFAEQTMTVSAPVIAELSTPRFLSGGDQTVMAFELRNLTDITQNLTIGINTQGLIKLLDYPLSQQVSLAPQEQRVMQIPATAEYGYGQGKITVNIDNVLLADGDNYHLSRAWAIGVRPPYAATTRASSAALNGGEGWTLSPAALTDLIANTVDAEIVISHNPPFNIAKYIKSLYAYPYGCLEQTISRLYPSLYVNEEILKKLGIEGDSDDQRRKNVQIGIDRLFGMQRNNGSFGLWGKESPEEYWLTVYAVDFLLRAQERGYHVNQQGLTHAFERLAQYIYDPAAFYNLNGYYASDIESYIEFATKSYAALILAKQHKITPSMRNELKRLYQQVKSNDSTVLLSPLPIMQLAIASKLTGNNRSADDLFNTALMTNRDSQYYWLGDYGSAIRDKAQIYNLMVEYQLETDAQASYLLKLSNSLRNERYLSTQELSALFLVSWQNMQQKEQENIVVLFNNKESIKAKETIYRTMDYKQLSNGISVHNPYNAAPLYISFSMSGYAKKMPPPTPANNVLNITRQYFDLKGKPITAEQLNVGDMVIVMLDVRANTVINDALVVDMLPAGLEIENPNLSNSYVDIRAIPQLAELLKEESSSDVRYQEYRDDRYVAAIDVKNSIANNRYRTRLTYLARAVTVGTYAVPAPFVESMYKPEWNALGNTLGFMIIADKTNRKD